MRMLRIPGLVPGHEKALVGALIATLGAVVLAFGPESTAGKIAAIIITGLTGLAGVYSIPNTGYANTQEVVAAVKDVVSDDVAEVITEAVSETKTGVLKNVT